MSTEFFKESDFDGCLRTGLAARANALLRERGTVAYSSWEPDEQGGVQITGIWRTSFFDNKNAKERALLINVEPFKQETPERALLREIVSAKDGGKYVCLGQDILERAKKLLESETK